jgi:hypothetical protein
MIYWICDTELQTYITEDNDVISCVEVLQLMCDQYSSLPLEEAADTIIKQVAPHTCVHSGQWVIKQVDVCFFVNSSENREVPYWTLSTKSSQNKCQSCLSL